MPPCGSPAPACIRRRPLPRGTWAWNDRSRALLLGALCCLLGMLALLIESFSDTSTVGVRGSRNCKDLPPPQTKQDACLEACPHFHPPWFLGLVHSCVLPASPLSCWKRTMRVSAPRSWQLRWPLARLQRHGLGRERSNQPNSG